MAIATSCEECGRDYSVKDELAGKKFKCKDCGAIVAIPAPRKRGNSASSAKKAPPRKKDPDDEFQEALNSDRFDEDDYGDDADEQDEMPRRVAKRKPVAKKKKKSSRGSSGSSAMWAKIGGGVFTALIVLSIVGRLIRVAGGLGVGVGGGVSWQEFRAPNGRYTVSFPGVGKAKMQAVPGVTTYLAETRNFACAVTHAPLPAGSGALMAQLSPQALCDQITKDAFPGVHILTNRPVTLGGLPSHEISFDKNGLRLTERTVVVGDEMFNCEFVSKGGPPAAELTRFFDSFRINGVAGNAAATVPGNAAAPPGGAGNSQPAVSGTFQQRRLALQTKLVKSGPAPQQYQDEKPPPGVQVVTYPSGTLQLKAWVAAPNGGAGPKAPALVFFTEASPSEPTIWKLAAPRWTPAWL